MSGAGSRSLCRGIYVYVVHIFRKFLFGGWIFLGLHKGVSYDIAVLKFLFIIAEVIFLGSFQH